MHPDAAHCHFLRLFHTNSAIAADLVSQTQAVLAQGDVMVAIVAPPRLNVLHQILPLPPQPSARVQLYSAEEMLPGLWDGKRLQQERFLAQAEQLLQCGRRAAERRGGRLVVWGELVLMLWKERAFRAALQLEELWNGLAAQHSLTLNCPLLTASAPVGSEVLALLEACAVHSALAAPERSLSKTNIAVDPALREFMRRRVELGGGTFIGVIADRVWFRAAQNQPEVVSVACDACTAVSVREQLDRQRLRQAQNRPADHDPVLLLERLFGAA